MSIRPLESTEEIQVAAKRQKVEPTDMITLRFLIDNVSAGAVIGKQGSTIKSIRQQTSCFLSILKLRKGVSAKERILSVKGMPANLPAAVALVAGVLFTIAQGRKATEESKTELVEGADFAGEVKFLVHKFLAGPIIGKKGSVVKEIKETIGSRVIVSNESLGTSTEKVVTVNATLGQMPSTFAKIIAQITENPLRPGTFESVYEPGQIAYAQAGFPQVMPDSHLYPAQTPVPMYRAPAAGYGGPVPNAYGSQVANAYGAQVPNPYGAQVPNAYFSQSSGPDSSAVYPGYTQQPTAAAGAVGTKSFQKIVIPTACAGAVIGTGGSIIKNIMALSQTNIAIGKPEPTAPGDRIVTITGTSEGIQEAIQLIKVKVESI